MSYLYRLSRMRFARDMTGEGARIKGGRWTQKGIPVIHTSESAATACMEYLVHLGNPRFFPGDVALITYELHEDATILTVDETSLPANWREVPAPGTLQMIGTSWCNDQSYLGLRLPSVPIPLGEHKNVLINPNHPEFEEFFTISSIDLYEFDSRLRTLGR